MQPVQGPGLSESSFQFVQHLLGIYSLLANIAEGSGPEVCDGRGNLPGGFEVSSADGDHAGAIGVAIGEPEVTAGAILGFKIYQRRYRFIYFLQIIESRW